MENNFELEEALTNRWELEKSSNFNAFDILYTRIFFLLENDFHFLMHALYRLDLNERTLEEAMDLKGNELIATFLTRKSIERELQKIETRKIYTQVSKKYATDFEEMI